MDLMEPFKSRGSQTRGKKGGISPAEGVQPKDRLRQPAWAGKKKSNS